LTGRSGIQSVTAIQQGADARSSMAPVVEEASCSQTEEGGSELAGRAKERRLEGRRGRQAGMQPLSLPAGRAATLRSPAHHPHRHPHHACQGLGAGAMDGPQPDDSLGRTLKRISSSRRRNGSPKPPFTGFVCSPSTAGTSGKFCPKSADRQASGSFQFGRCCKSQQRQDHRCLSGEAG
jgi:hypothetical protein